MSTRTTTTQKENLAVAYANGALYVSFHTADPGSTGANEIAGTRAAITWTPGPTDGQITGTASGAVANGTAVAYVGFWTAVSGGTFLDSAAGAATSNGTVNVNITVPVT